MNKNEQMITYKVSFFDKIKEKLKKIFFKSDSIIENNSKKEAITNEKTKVEILEIYDKVKNNAVDINDLDSDILYKIMLLLKEEMQISNRKLMEEFNQTKLHLYNLKMYNKEIELLKKDS